MNRDQGPTPTDARRNVHQHSKAGGKSGQNVRGTGDTKCSGGNNTYKGGASGAGGPGESVL